MPNVHFPMVINSDREMQIIFKMYRQYLQHITTVELYVNLKEIIVKTGELVYITTKLFEVHIPLGKMKRPFLIHIK